MFFNVSAASARGHGISPHVRALLRDERSQFVSIVSLSRQEIISSGMAAAQPDVALEATQSTCFQDLALLLLWAFMGPLTVGYIPLLLQNASPWGLEFASAAGSGMLLGTALITVIPEGYSALYSSVQHTEVLPGGGDGPASHAGLATAMGFGFMYLVDRVSALSGITTGWHAHAPSDMETNFKGHAAPPTSVPKCSAEKASLGLLIHSFTDGVPLGTAACSGGSTIQMTLLLAILLHKTPAAFGLTSFLLRAGHERRSAFQSLILFCIAAPLSALSAATLIHAGALDASAGSGSSTTGLCLLFSGGTFIYTVAAHVLPASAHGPASLAHTAAFVGGLGLPYLIEVAQKMSGASQGHAH